MHKEVMTLGVALFALAACSTTPSAPSESSDAPDPVAAPAATASAPATFWDNAPLGDGDHLKVHIDDRARAGDCDELDATFATLTEGEPVEGYTAAVLGYLDNQRDATVCVAQPEGPTASPEPGASTSPSPSLSAS